MAALPLPNIRRNIARVAPEVVAQAAQLQVAILADVAGRRGTLKDILPLVSTMKLAGAALTVEVRPGDNLMIHAALSMAQPGDVLVIDGKGDTSCALMGMLMIHTCKVLQLGGVVVHGAVRDTAEMRELGFPVFASGINPNGPTKMLPGRVNCPVSLAGIVVRAGDLIVGDADGVVVIERENASALLPLATQKVAEENARLINILNKKTLRPVWLDAALLSAGVLSQGETL